MSTVVRVDYTGLAESCLLRSDPDEKELSALIGDAGSEILDSDFGTAGVLDLDGLTVADLVAAIDAIDDYTAEVLSGDATVLATAILEAEAQAASASAYLVASPTSVLTEDALISWETARTFLSSSNETLSEEDRAVGEKLINAASTRANAISHRMLRSRTHTHTLDGPGGDLVILPEYPVSAITEVRIDTGRTFPDSSILTASSYDHYEDGRLYIPGGIPHARRSVRVTYTAGYDPVPEDLQQAIVECVAYTWKRLHSRAIGTSSITADGITTQFEIDIPMPARRVIESYGRIS